MIKEMFGGVKGLVCRGDEGTGTSSAWKSVQWTDFSKMGPAGPKNREQEWQLTRSKSLPQRPKGAIQGKVARSAGRGRSPCGIDGLGAFVKENDLFRLSRNNASIFREIHLPLNRQLRCLGKAFGYRISPTNQKLPD